MQLWVVGDDSLPYAQEIKQKVQADQLSVTFFGKVPVKKKFELLQRAHLLVHGSYKEGWGLVIIEANASGTPAVVFDAAGLRNSVQHNLTGYVAQTEEEYINFCRELLTNQAKYEDFQSQALHWSNQFTWQKSTHKSLQLISNTYI